jgi:hypothetical protein
VYHDRCRRCHRQWRLALSYLRHHPPHRLRRRLSVSRISVPSASTSATPSGVLRSFRLMLPSVAPSADPSAATSTAPSAAPSVSEQCAVCLPISYASGCTMVGARHRAIGGTIQHAVCGTERHAGSPPISDAFVVLFMTSAAPSTALSAAPSVYIVTACRQLAHQLRLLVYCGLCRR